MLPHCDFLDCPYLFSRCYAQVEPLDRFSGIMAQTTCFQAMMVLLGVRMIGDHIWGNMPQKQSKNGRESQYPKTHKLDQDQI